MAVSFCFVIAFADLQMQMLRLPSLVDFENTAKFLEKTKTGQMSKFRPKKYIFKIDPSTASLSSDEGDEGDIFEFSASFEDVFTLEME